MPTPAARRGLYPRRAFFARIPSIVFWPLILRVVASNNLRRITTSRGLCRAWGGRALCANAAVASSPLGRQTGSHLGATSVMFLDASRRNSPALVIATRTSRSRCPAIPAMTRTNTDPPPSGRHWPDDPPCESPVPQLPIQVGDGW